MSVLLSLALGAALHRPSRLRLQLGALPERLLAPGLNLGWQRELPVEGKDSVLQLLFTYRVAGAS